METENLKVIIGEIKEGVEGRIRAEQETDRYKAMYEEAVQTIAEREEQIASMKKKEEEMEGKMQLLQNQVFFLQGRAAAMMQISNLICLNSSKFKYSLTHLPDSNETMYTIIAVVESSLYEGSSSKEFDDVKHLAYEQAGQKADNTFKFGEGSQTTIIAK